MKELKLKNILFDADDTLWHDSKYFRILEEKLIQLGKRIEIERHEIKRILKNNLKTEPKGERGYANAILNTAIKLNFSDQEIQIIKEETRKFLDHPIELIEGLVEALEKLNFNKVIFTKGVYKEQIKKINNSKIAAYFDNIIVVKKKNDDVLKSILVILDFNPKETLLIGNSIIHDIEPAIKNDIKAIWFNHNINYHGRNSLLPTEVKEINSWGQLANIINGLYV